MDTITKRAIELQPGDRCIGPGIFVLTGTVKSTGVSGPFVQINWEGGTHTVRPKDSPVIVRAT